MPCAYPPPCPWCLYLCLVFVPVCPCPMPVFRGIQLVGKTAAPRCKEYLSAPSCPTQSAYRWLSWGLCDIFEGGN